MWVRLPGLPVEYYDEAFLLRIGNALGKAIKVDHQTISATRGKYVRLCVEVDLKQALVPFLWVDRELQAVEYEGLEAICFECGRYGHVAINCHREKEDSGETSEERRREREKKEKEAESKPYGPWMVASKRRPRVDNMSKIGTAQSIPGANYQQEVQQQDEFNGDLNRKGKVQ